MLGMASALRFGEFEADVAGAADGHEREQRRVEIRHREIAVDAEDEHAAQYPGPREHLQPVQRRAIEIGGQVFEPASGDEGPDGIIVGSKQRLAVEDFGLQLQDALLA